VWLPSRYLLAAVCLLVSGCGGSHSPTYDAQEVAKAFRANGLKVEVTDAQSIHAYFGKQGGTVLGLLKLFSGGRLRAFLQGRGRHGLDSRQREARRLMGAWLE
jgi:hypothetical protein